MTSLSKEERLYGNMIWAINGILNFLILLGALIFLVYGSYSIWDTNAIVSESLPAQYADYKPSSKEDFSSFDNLKRENPDAIGWLTIYGTGIDYPLMQAKNNEKYLDTDSHGKYSLTGSIFLDYRNDKSLNDFNSIIYGHHMAYHTMFGDISLFKEKEFFDTHKYGRIFYGDSYHGLEFFIFAEVDAYDTAIYEPATKESYERDRYLKNIKREAKFLRAIDVSSKDNIIILSTCTTDITNGRHILIGRITDKVWEDTFKNKVGAISSIDSYLSVNKEILSTWSLVILVLTVIIVITFRRAKTKKYRR